MADSLLFSLNSVVPIFLLVLIGRFLCAKGILPESFFTVANKFVFRVTLPITLFCDVVDGGAIRLNGLLTVYCIVFLAIELVLLFLFVPLFVKDNPRRGAVIQGAYRSNVAIMGVPLINSLFGEVGGSAMATVMPIMVVLYNALAVVILSFFAPDDKKKSAKEIAIGIGKNIICNPLILGIAAGILFLALPISMPTFLSRTLNYFDGLTMPLALMSLGASFHFAQLRGRIKLACMTTALRCILFPFLAILGAVLVGLRDAELGVVFVLFGSSTAIASYVMSESMGSDSVLSGQIVLLTTVCSAFTVFIGTTILRFFGLF